MKDFKCMNGKTYRCPDESCLFCEHNTDIFYDSRGIYMLICDLHKDVIIGTEGKCESFKEG